MLYLYIKKHRKDYKSKLYIHNCSTQNPQSLVALWSPVSR